MGNTPRNRKTKNYPIMKVLWYLLFQDSLYFEMEAKKDSRECHVYEHDVCCYHIFLLSNQHDV